jgi:cephalosporin hydroxylase
MQLNKSLVLGLAALAVFGLVFGSSVANEKPPSRAETIERFTNLYFATNVHYQTGWLGVPSLQNPCDMWVMQEIISETKPDFIIETGTYKGGGSLFLATVLRLVNERGRVLTVDIKPQVEQASRYPLFQEAVEVFAGSSVSEEIVKAIAEKVKGAKVMVTLDSDHSRSHVLRELEIYSRFVSVNSYLIVQDTAHNGHPLPTHYDGGGPMAALQDFLKKHKNFVPDRSREKFLLTFFPQGYLKRRS